MLEKLSSCMGLCGLIEITVRVNAIFTILKNRVTENVLHIGVTVLPDERDLHSVLMLECIGHDDQSI